MQSSDVDRLVMLAREWWPSWEPTPMTAAAWEPVIGQYEYPVVAEAMRQYLISGSHYGKPDIGAVGRMLAPRVADVDEVIAICDRWYRATDDVDRFPTREQRERHPVAAMTWDMAGGFDALHDKAWAHQRLRKAYEEASVIAEERQRQGSIAIASGSADRDVQAMLGGVGRRMELE